MSLVELKNKLGQKNYWINKRYDYYEGKHLRVDPSEVIPMRDKTAYQSTLGWCAKAVDSLADRLTLAGFENDVMGLWDIFKLNNLDVLADSAIRSALISACSFIYIALVDGEIKLQVIDGMNATGTIDDTTSLLTEGYAILDIDDKGNVKTDAYFLPDRTEIYNGGKLAQTISNPTGYPLLVPIIYRPSNRKPFGQSRISRACMDLQDKARFVLTNASVASDFGSFPQKYITGLSPDAEFDTVMSAYKQILAIDMDADGNKPTVGQFTQVSVTGCLEHIKTLAGLFAGETGLTLDDLGFPNSAPASTQAVRAGHGELEHIAKKAQDIFGRCFKNVGFVAFCLKDGSHYSRNLINTTEVLWRPTFAMDSSAIGSFGDAIIKINQAVPNAISADTIQRITGLPIEVNNGTGYSPSASTGNTEEL